MSMNAVKIVTEYLEAALEADAVSSLDTLFERVAMDRLPPDFDNTEPALTVQEQAASPAAAIAPILRHQLVIKCYGGTSDYVDAENVAQRVYDVLHNAQGDTDTGGIVFSELVTQSRFYEPDTGWPCILAIYQIDTL